jgi:outer membrane protein assembly factor BamD
MKQRFFFYFRAAGSILLIGLLLVGCGRRDVTVQLPAEERYERGMRFFNDGNYVRAIDEFRIVTRQYSGSEYADNAQYYLALSYFNRGEYILAASEFETLINTMGGSPLVPESQYMLATSFFELSPRYDLDQEYTIRAIEELQTFIDFFPTDEKVPDAEEKIRQLTLKLARKEYQTAELYMRMKYYRAATRMYDVVIERYHDTPFAELAYVGKVESLIQRERFDEAQQTIEQFLRQFPESDHRTRVRTLQQRVASELRSRNHQEEESRTSNGTSNRMEQM